VRNWIDQRSLSVLRVGRRVRVIGRDLDLLIADAETTSRVNARTASAEGDAGQRRRDAGQFWGGLEVRWPVRVRTRSR
jgi:hypothetical protein